MKSLLKASKSITNFNKPFNQYFTHIWGDFNIGSVLHGFSKITVEIYILFEQMILDICVIML